MERHLQFFTVVKDFTQPPLVICHITRGMMFLRVGVRDPDGDGRPLFSHVNNVAEHQQKHHAGAVSVD